MLIFIIVSAAFLFGGGLILASHIASARTSRYRRTF